MFERIKVWMFKSKYLNDIIEEQQKKIEEQQNEYIKLYNEAINKIVQEYNIMIIFNDSGYPEFNGMLGLKFNKRQSGYKKDFEEIIIQFPTGATYYWYFYKLGQKMIEQKPLASANKSLEGKSKVNNGIKSRIPEWMEKKLNKKNEI